MHQSYPVYFHFPMGDIAGNQKTPKRRGFHVDYGIYIGGHEVDDSCNLNPANHFKYAMQCFNIEAFGIINLGFRNILKLNMFEVGRSLWEWWRVELVSSSLLFYSSKLHLYDKRFSSIICNYK